VPLQVRGDKIKNEIEIKIKARPHKSLEKIRED
jgi:hypothetical protein